MKTALKKSLKKLDGKTPYRRTRLKQLADEETPIGHLLPGVDSLGSYDLAIKYHLTHPFAKNGLLAGLKDDTRSDKTVDMSTIRQTASFMLDRAEFLTSIMKYEFIARRLDDETSIFGARTILGTPLYIANDSGNEVRRN
jgi:hypothetical protein